jgi:hypothetical protein
MSLVLMWLLNIGLAIQYLHYNEKFMFIINEIIKLIYIFLKNHVYQYTANDI